MDNIQFSPHFSLNELLASNTATTKGFTEQWTPNEDVVNSLKVLAIKVLEPIRELINAPINISSGYRCKALNKAVGGEPTSQHVLGEAADITTPNLTVANLYQTIKTSKIEFDELIIETDEKGAWWVHVSYNSKGNQRGLCLKGVLQPNGGTLCVSDGYGSFRNN